VSQKPGLCQKHSKENLREEVDHAYVKSLYGVVSNRLTGFVANCVSGCYLFERLAGARFCSMEDEVIGMVVGAWIDEDEEGYF